MEEPENGEGLEALKQAAAAGDHEEARRLAQDMQVRFPAEAEGWRAGIAAARALGDLSGALAMAERAEVHFPEAPWPLAQRAWLTRGLGRIEETIALTEALRSRFPAGEVGYAAGLGALRSRERLAEALEVAEEAVKRFPHQAQWGAQAAELRAVIENRTSALALTAELAQIPPAFPRPRVVVLLGMHRTGTSLAAQMLQNLGVGLGGPLMPANFANPDGYFEHLDVVAAQEAALRTMGASWDTCWSALPQTPRLAPEAYAQTRTQLEAVAERELEAQGGLWGFKDPRTLRFLPMWDEIFARLGVEPIFVLSLRDPRAVAASLYARDRMPHAIGELLWIEHVSEALARLGPRLSLILHFERWFEAPEAQVEALARVVRAQRAGRRRRREIGAAPPSALGERSAGAAALAGAARGADGARAQPVGLAGARVGAVAPATPPGRRGAGLSRRPLRPPAPFLYPAHAKQGLAERRRRLQRGGAGGRERFAEAEALAAHRQHEGGRRAADDLGEHVEHRLGRKRMRGRGAGGGGVEIAKAERRAAGARSVDEQREVEALQIERVLDLQLIVFDGFHVGQPHRLDAAQQQRPERVVAARLVAPAQHDDAGQLRTWRSTRAPAASSNDTSSGMAPSAWVAQERQGS